MRPLPVGRSDRLTLACPPDRIGEVVDRLSNHVGSARTDTSRNQAINDLRLLLAESRRDRSCHTISIRIVIQRIDGVSSIVESKGRIRHAGDRIGRAATSRLNFAACVNAAPAGRRAPEVRGLRGTRALLRPGKLSA